MEAIKEENREECFSAGDFEEEFDDKFQLIDELQAPRLGLFEKVEYFEKVFPSLKI